MRDEKEKEINRKDKDTMVTGVIMQRAESGIGLEKVMIYLSLNNQEKNKHKAQERREAMKSPIPFSRSRFLQK